MYVDSSKIKFYPSAWRQTGSGNSAQIVNPESRLNTEYNLTNLLRSFLQTTKGSFIVKGSTLSNVEFYLGGYYVHLKENITSATEFSSATDIYAHLKVADRSAGDYKEVFEAQPFTNNGGAGDVSFLDGEGTFKGILFDTSSTTEGSEYSLKIFTKTGGSWGLAEESVIDFASEISRLDSAINTKVDKTSGVTNVSYSDKTIKKTINGTTTNVVSASSLKSDMELNNVANTGDSATPVEDGTTKFTTGGAYTELNKKVDKTKGVTNVGYDTTEKKFYQVINSASSDVVFTSQLQSDMNFDSEYYYYEIETNNLPNFRISKEDFEKLRDAKISIIAYHNTRYEMQPTKYYMREEKSYGNSELTFSLANSYGVYYLNISQVDANNWSVTGGYRDLHRYKHLIQIKNVNISTWSGNYNTTIYLEKFDTKSSAYTSSQKLYDVLTLNSVYTGCFNYTTTTPMYHSGLFKITKENNTYHLWASSTSNEEPWKEILWDSGDSNAWKIENDYFIEI